eukprot:5694309-Prymnesium_polylepis.1
MNRPDGLAGGLRRRLDVLRADSRRHGGRSSRAQAPEVADAPCGRGPAGGTWRSEVSSQKLGGGTWV